MLFKLVDGPSDETILVSSHDEPPESLLVHDDGECHVYLIARRGEEWATFSYLESLTEEELADLQHGRHDD